MRVRATVVAIASLLCWACYLYPKPVVCGVGSAEAPAHTVEGGNQTVVFRSPQAFARPAGQVRYGVGEPAADAVVELFVARVRYCKGDAAGELPWNWPDSAGRVAATISGKDGTFCLPKVATGCYEVRASYSSEVNVTHVFVWIDAESGSAGPLEVLLELGT